MLSSTSSSDQRLPRLPWKLLLGGAGLILLSFVLGLEMILAARGYRADAVDGHLLWIEQRMRVDPLQTRALVLVGASRMRLDTDLAVLRARTGLEPVQLAITGSSFLPVLRDLASDPAMRGTVLVDYTDGAVAQPDVEDAAEVYVAAYEKRRAHPRLPDFSVAEDFLTALQHRHLRSFADGATPLDSLMLRAFVADSTQQYLITLPDRSQLADYRKVAMPEFYYRRVVRNLAQPVIMPPAVSYAALEADLKARIQGLTPVVAAGYFEGATEVARLAKTIEARGGRVLFVVMPTSGYVREIDDRRFPRRQYWDAFVALTSAKTLHFEDVPAMRALVCPDGSHLDYRDRARFTVSLVEALKLERAQLMP